MEKCKMIHGSVASGGTSNTLQPGMFWWYKLPEAEPGWMCSPYGVSLARWHLRISWIQRETSTRNTKSERGHTTTCTEHSSMTGGRI